MVSGWLSSLVRSKSVHVVPGSLLLRRTCRAIRVPYAWVTAWHSPPQNPSALFFYSLGLLAFIAWMLFHSRHEALAKHELCHFSVTPQFIRTSFDKKIISFTIDKFYLPKPIIDSLIYYILCMELNLIILLDKFYLTNFTY